MATVRFILNGQPVAENTVPPAMTVLDYLRTVKRLTGTKEGCAEGDCGACTIVLSRRTANGLCHEAVNSCLMIVPQLDGAAVTTVEGLSPPGGPLHPVQQALADGDGTQCGFCTPGFVMAMAAFQQGGEEATDSAIHEALAGNLCRCTGYRPIVDACKRAAGEPAGIPGATEIEAGLAARRFDNEYSRDGQRFFAPRDVPTLLTLLQYEPSATLLGGGTDLGLVFSKERRGLPVVISTAQVTELRHMAFKPDVVELGGAVTYTEALPDLDKAFPAFGALVRRIGSRQIRNLGTLAGNIVTASPIGDTLPCLMALGATVVLRSNSGTREMKVEDFITGYRKTALTPGEFIEEIHIPRLARGRQFFVYKLSKRFDQDISAVIGAFVVEIADGKLAHLDAVYGGMAATPKRAVALQVLQGDPWTEATLANVGKLIAQDFQPLSDFRASAEYRLRAAANLVRRLYHDTTGAPARLETL